MFSHGDHSFAACTGRYAGRKAAGYAREVNLSDYSREQVTREKNRVYAPIKRDSGVEWKELNAGIARVMQYFCSEYKTESLLKTDSRRWMKSRRCSCRGCTPSTRTS